MVVGVVIARAAAIMVAHIMFGDKSTVVAAFDMHGMGMGFTPFA
jgi:hypothetical protein